MNFWSILMLLSFSLLLVASCSKDKDEPQNNDVQSPATLDDLFYHWGYIPNEGIKTGEIYEDFFFGRVAGKTTCTISKYIRGETEKREDDKEIEKTHYGFSFNAPYVTLTNEQDQVVRTLTVYKLTRDESYSKIMTGKWLLIDGKIYLGLFRSPNF